jgi:cell division transport system ATP-binding protein
MINFKNVSKYFDGQPILKNVTFSIEKAEMSFVIGPSGAGKSTLLKLIYLDELPDEGDITVANFHTATLKKNQIPEYRRNIGVVFQDFKLLYNLNIYDNVALALRVRGIDEKTIKTSVSNALKLVHLRHKFESFPATLSGGEQQRVAIARAIVAEPPVLLADEPTGNLDINTATDIMNLFKEINIRGTTILIATHNRELAKNCGSKIFKLDGGNLSEEVIR